VAGLRKDVPSGRERFTSDTVGSNGDRAGEDPGVQRRAIEQKRQTVPVGQGCLRAATQSSLYAIGRQFDTLSGHGQNAALHGSRCLRLAVLVEGFLSRDYASEYNLRSQRNLGETVPREAA
jgi:hypothetical protein